MGDEIRDGVFAVAIEAGDLGDGLDAPAGAAPLDEHEQIDGLGDQPARHGDNRFLAKLFDAKEGRAGGIGMHSGDARRDGRYSRPSACPAPRDRAPHQR